MAKKKTTQSKPCASNEFLQGKECPMLIEDENKAKLDYKAKSQDRYNFPAKEDRAKFKEYSLDEKKHEQGIKEICDCKCDWVVSEIVPNKTKVELAGRFCSKEEAEKEAKKYRRKYKPIAKDIKVMKHIEFEKIDLKDIFKD